LRTYFVSIQNRSVQIAFFTGFWLALVGCLVVQCLQIFGQEGSYALAVRLNFQIASLLS